MRARTISPSLWIALAVSLACAWPAPAAASAAVAERGAAAEDAPARAALDIREIALDNGLRVFVLERTTSPTFAALYQFGVGGATDPKGRSGIAHLLEHMLFKGTTSIGTLDAAREAALLDRLDRLWDELHVELDRREDPFGKSDPAVIERLEREIEQVSAEHKKLVVKNEYDELLTRAGSVSLNASTNQDVTRYQVQLPANRLEMWFRLESERLLHPVFREFYSERDVVHEERRLRTDNTASGRAFEAMNSLLFTAHPYRNPVVGWPRDLLRLRRQDALDYFTTYYSPSNCVMVLVGDVRPAEVERLARKYFAPWKRQEIPPLPITAEPEQQGERRRIVEFDARPELRMAWLTVPEGHPDMYALDVLASVLGGLSSSRIDQTIVQRERLASRAGSGHPTSRYAGWFSVSGVLRGERTAGELETAFEREIARIQNDGVSALEVERARTAVEASRVRGLKSNMGQAFRIADAVFVSGSTAYIEDYVGRINAVTPEQVQAVAKRYLQPQRKNVVEVRNRANLKGQASAAGGGVEHQHGGTVGARGQKHSRGFDQMMKVMQAAAPVQLRIPEIGRDVERVVLPSGITLFLKEDHSAPSIDMAWAWLGGSNSTPVGELAPFELASSLLTQGGTESLGPTELDARMDELGMDFNISIGSTQSGAGFWSLSRNFEESFDVAMDMLMRPRLDGERLETLKGQYIESMRRRYESPGSGVGTLLNHVVYREHPRLGYVPARREIEGITPDAVRAIWKRYLGRDNLYITAVGDFDSARMREMIERRLGNWRKAEDRERVWITYEPMLRPGAWLVEKDLPQPAVRLFHQIAVDRNAPMAEHAAIEITNDILGGSGFRSRLVERLRSDEGLTYGIGSFIAHQGRPGEPGRLQISYQTKQDSVARSIDSVLQEVRKIIEQQVTQAEVTEQIEAWRNRFIFNYTNDFSIVSRLMYSELDDRPYDFDRQVLDAVQKVTVEDVQRAARAYLKPDTLTIAMFGVPTEADRKALTERFNLKVLPKTDVFTGGYDDAGKASMEPAKPSALEPSTSRR